MKAENGTANWTRQKDDFKRFRRMKWQTLLPAQVIKMSDEKQDKQLEVIEAVYVAKPSQTDRTSGGM